MRNAGEETNFKLYRSDGIVSELHYHQNTKVSGYSEPDRIRRNPFFESGKPMKNWMLHDIDNYDEVEGIWGERWGGEGLGRLREVLMCRPTSNEFRSEFVKEWQYYQLAGPIKDFEAHLTKSIEQFDNLVRTYKECGVKVNIIDPPVPTIGIYGYLKNLITLAGAGLVMHGGAIITRAALGPWQRGREVLYTKALLDIGVPVYLSFRGKAVCEIGAGRWLDGKRFIMNEGIVGNEEGLRQVKPLFDEFGFELITCHSPGWINKMFDEQTGLIGTWHVDWFLHPVKLGLVLLYPDLVNYGMVRYLMDNKVEVLEIPNQRELFALGGNVGLIEDGKIIIDPAAKSTRKELENRGVECIEVDFSEGSNAGYGMHCAVLDLLRDQPSPTLEEVKR